MSKKNKAPKVKKPSWWDEFKAFAVKGNAMALAVGTIIGASFTSITKSLTDHIIMPIVNMFFGGVDFSAMMLKLPRMPWVEAVPLLDEAGNQVVNAAGELQYVENYLRYGDFLSAVINFFIIALVVFFLVKGLNKLSEAGKKKEDEAPAEEPAPPEPTAEEKLLTEIRDLLKDK